jgi:PAS domain S-box-containing protein
MLSNLIELTYNLAILLALSVVSGFLRQRRELRVLSRVFQGLLFGLAALIGMLRPLVFAPGLIFDGRSVMISLCGLFFGPLAVSVAAAMALAYRILLGGVGVYLGILVILSSAALGLAFHQRWVLPGKPLTARRLWEAGLCVHVSMVLLMFTLPRGMGLATVQHVGPVILLVYPLMTLLIGKLLANQEASLDYLESLRQSEARNRALLNAIPDLIFTNGGDGTFLDVHAADPAQLVVPPETFLQRKPQEVLPGFLAERFLKAQADARATGSAQELAYALPMGDQERHFEARVVPGAGDTLITIVRDVTDRKRAEAESKRSEEALQRQNALLSALLKTLPIGVFMVEAPSGKPLVANEVALELLGRGLLPQVTAEALPEVYRSFKAGSREPYPPAEMPILRAMAGQSSHIEDMAVVHADGTEHLLEVFGSPVTNGHGQVWAGVVSFLDITERKRAEETVRREQQFSKSVLESLPGIFYLYSYPELRLVLWNKQHETLLGFEASEMEGRHVTAWHVPEAKDAVIGAIQQVMAQGQSAIEAPLVAKDGHRVPFLLTGVKFEALGQPFLMGTGIDITDRRRALEELRQSEQKFRALFESMSEGVALHELVADAQGAYTDYRLLDVNPAYEGHTGLAAASAPGRLGTEIYGAEVPPYLEEYRTVALGGPPFAFETFFPPLDKHFRISVISPKLGHFATVFEDITDRKRREEELKQKNAEMERFTYMVSHDLKSPLVTVRTFLAYLEQDLAQGKADRAAKDMEFMRSATGKMTRLLEDLLEVSRVGRVVNAPVMVSLADLIQEALSAVAGAIASQKVEVRAKVPPLMLFGDRPRLEEIWQNLVENAVKYMDGQPAPRIELGCEGKGVDTVFFVWDNGMGIDPRFQHKVFDLFEKLDPSTEGTGLGLALVKRIVEIFEGRIWVDSEGSGQGACFRFTLPLALKERKPGSLPQSKPC